MDGVERAGRFLRGEGGGADDGRGLFLERLHQHLGLVGVDFGLHVAEVLDAGHEVGLLLDDAEHLESLEALEDGGDRAVGHLQGLDDLGDGAVAAQVRGERLFDGDVVLGDGPDETVVLLRVADEADRLFAADGDGIHRAREEDGVAQGEEREGVGPARLVHLHHRSVFLQDGENVDLGRAGRGKQVVICAHFHLFLQFVTNWQTTGRVPACYYIVNLRANYRGSGNRGEKLTNHPYYFDY